MGKHGRNSRGPQSQAKRTRIEGDEGDHKHPEDSGDVEDGESPKPRGAGYVSFHAATHADGVDERGITWLAGRAIANANFEKFYRAQPIFTSDEDYATFLQVCNTPLPVTFRVNILHAGASDALNAIRGTFGSITKGEALGEEAKGDESAAELAAPLLQPIPWYPRGLVFQFDIGRVALRKSPALSSFHAWVTRLNSNGVISRQELVSMLPPILLGVRPEHRVLDMCASPGSKTAQLLEALHGQEMPEGNIATVMKGGDLTRLYGEDGGCVPTGFVVANDKDNKRAYMLVHQTNRIASHCLVVTNHDASEYPKIKEARPATTPKELNKGFPGYFDRVLCDVPCSGDGTMRKNAEVFAKWSPAGGNGLHPLQVTIAMRGLQTLKVGGLMAYSTCTFNPIEDEAVLSEVLRR
jgi:16S rRNA C967 or C1407 C5-methylase (RsmB/RsmF family)